MSPLVGTFKHLSSLWLKSSGPILSVFFLNIWINSGTRSNVNSIDHKSDFLLSCHNNWIIWPRRLSNSRPRKPNNSTEPNIFAICKIFLVTRWCGVYCRCSTVVHRKLQLPDFSSVTYDWLVVYRVYISKLLDIIVVDLDRVKIQSSTL